MMIGPHPGSASSVRSDAPADAVLLVEDDEDLRACVSQFLSDSGYAVVSAADGREALDLLERDPAPALIVTDLMMPRMDGWELISRTRAIPALARIPVIVLSAVAERAKVDTTVAGVLRKPVELSVLLSAVKTFCRRNEH
jgi:CheY-like chemotaxis protein